MDQETEKQQPVEDQNTEQSFSENYQANFPEDANNFQMPNSKHKHKKLWLLIVVAVFIALIGVAQLYESIVKPLEYEVPDWILEQVQEDDQGVTIAELKEKDTDHDGLTDYQELYQYYTSMFLEDTDSDGLTDYEEANAGNDPLCPEGESCSLLKLITPKTKLSDIIQEVALDPDLTVQQAAVSEFRMFLAEQGLPQEQLDALTDEDLLTIFRILEESQVFSENDWTTTTTPEQVKAFLLIQPNADVDEINSLTDPELLEIRDKLLNQ